MMELKDTAALMCSDDYKDRFKAEYLQLKIRRDKLAAMLVKLDTGKLGFTPTCPRGLYMFQLYTMDGYLDILRDSAKLEGVEL